MSSDANLSTELADCLNSLSFILGGSVRILDGLIAATVDHESARVIRQEINPIPESEKQVLPLLLQAAGSSTHTLIQLSHSSGLHTRDCYSIARSIVETAVNLCYIMAEGDSAAKRALRHAHQKSYQDMERESNIGGTIMKVVYEGRPDPSEIEGLTAQIEEFTSLSKREKGWVDLSIDQRIEVAGKKLGSSVQINLQFARFNIYRHSSEVLHGTFFSALHFFGHTRPNNSEQANPGENIGQQHMLILFSCILALSGVVEGFHKAYGFMAAYNRSQSFLDSLHNIPYFARKIASQSEEDTDAS